MKHLTHIVVAFGLLLAAIVVGGTGVKIEYTYHTVGPSPQPQPEPHPGPQPNPEPQPGPNPGPTPPPPDPGPVDGPFGVSRLAWESARTLNRPDECRALVKAFSDLAEYVRENKPGVLVIIGDAEKGIRGLLATYLGRAIPGTSRQAWSQFSEVLKGAIKAAYGNGLLKKSDDWAACFDEVAMGLGAVR